ncbi:hypothetical protein [Prolixibacter bellariivorans]|nr:hypothetical protein [Prolixibacter bellariivorans]
MPRFGKERLSIRLIGQIRFWFGLSAGLLSALWIAWLFSCSREVFRFMTCFSADLLVLKGNELKFYNYFFSALATVLDLSIAIWIWMGNHSHKRKKDRIFKQLARTNALLVFWIILMVVARFGSLLPIILTGSPGYDNQLDLVDEFPILLILLPLIVFTQSWFAVKLVYRANRWIIISLVISIVFTVALKNTTSINQEFLNTAYFQKFEKDFRYIDEEISIAEKEYHLTFSAETIETLRKWHSEGAIEQMESIKAAFSENHPVSMDTIILQKIVIHNYKPSYWARYGRNSLRDWHYALPNDILKQIGYSHPDSDKTKELFLVLQEEIDLVNTPLIQNNEYRNYTWTERRRSLGRRYDIPVALMQQLSDVRDSLINDHQYEELSKILPEIKNSRLQGTAQ